MKKIKKRLIDFWQTNPTSKTKLILKDISIVSFILFATFSWLDFINPQTLPQFLQPFIFLIISLASLSLFFKEKIHFSLNEFLKYGFLISLLAVTIGSLNFEFISNIHILENVVDFLNENLLMLSIISIILGFSIFHFNKNKIDLSIKETPQKYSKIKNYCIVLIIFSLFLITKFFFILKYPGNFADDWQHIIAGSTFFENGHFHRISNHFENGYLRGSYVSFTVAIFFYLFGKTIFIAKLVPALIGSINFFLFYFISKKIFKNKLFIYLGLLIFTFNTWIIFNHLYIRTYVFFELFLLLSIFIFIKIIDAIRKNKTRLLFIYFIILALINYLNWFWSYDSGKYPILIASLVGLTYLFFFEINKIKLNNKNFLLKQVSYIKNLNFIKKFYLWLSFSIIFFLINLKKIKWIQDAEAPSAKGDNVYFQFFFETNIYLTILFILSILFIFSIKNTYAKMISLMAIVLLIIHFSLNPNLQIIRGILYLIPLFVLISIYSLNILFKITIENKSYLNHFLFFTIIIFGLIINIKNNFTKDFLSIGPEIKHEVGYSDYVKTYEYLNNYHADKKILQADYNVMAELFFNIKTSYQIDLNNILLDSITHEYNENLERNFQIPTKTPVIIQEEEFYDFINNNKTCIVTRQISEKRFFTPESWNYMKKRFKKEVTYNNFSIYCN